MTLHITTYAFYITIDGKMSYLSKIFARFQVTVNSLLILVNLVWYFYVHFILIVLIGPGSGYCIKYSLLTSIYLTHSKCSLYFSNQFQSVFNAS